MKKFILLLLATTSLNINAQKTIHGYDDTQHEIAISTGVGTNTQIISGFSKLFEVLLSTTVSTVFTGGTFTGYTNYENEKEFTPISAEYFYHLNHIVGIGGIFCYNGTSYDMYGNLRNNNDGTTQNVMIGEGSTTNLTLLPAVKFDWLRTTYFGMYSKFGIGVTMLMEKEKLDYEGQSETLHDDTSFMFNWQASLLGMEAGIPNVRVFWELGCGEQGILLAGLRCKF